MTREIGVVGLGKMGLPMARHLLSKGFQVTGYDTREESLAAAQEAGVVVRGSPREVAEGSRMVLVVVGFDTEVRQVFTTQDGLLSGAAPGTTVAIASTVEPGTSREMGAIAQSQGVHCLDIPLCRGEPAAEAGDLLVMGGGEKSVFDEGRDVFQAFASDIFYLGPLGAGQVGKMINNLLLWACIAADFEGLKLGEALGVAPETLRQALLKSSGNNWALETWERGRAMPWAEKDMTIVAKMADQKRLSLPLCGVVKEVVKFIKTEWGLPTPPSPAEK